jgi:hypothetical protein
MARSQTTPPDLRELQLGFALCLYDRFTGGQQLAGKMGVRLANKPLVRPFVPLAKAPDAAFLFFDLPAGPYMLEVRSNREGRADQDQTRVEEEDYLNQPAYYSKVDISIVLPMPTPRWPAFPDATLADPSKPLDDPNQSVAYRNQRDVATLLPTAAYPFPAGATLARGAVLSGGIPLNRARVRQVGGDPLHPTGAEDLVYETGPDGEFVLFFSKLNGTSKTVTLRASHALHLDVDQNVLVRRGLTVSQNIVMA